MTSGLPHVFLLPGIGGDEPPLANLRAALADRIDFELLDYPGVDRPSHEIRDFDGIVRQAVDRIGALQPKNVQIVGYSFGALVAFAAACRLQAEGRQVLLALLDSMAPSLKLSGSSGRVRNRDEKTGPGLALADIASRALIAAGLSEAVRGAIGPTRRIFGAAAGNALRRMLLQNLRGRSLTGLILGRFEGQILAFRARDQLVSSLPLDLGWSAHCSSVRTVELRGGHNSLFRPENLAENAKLIGSELACQRK